MAAEFKTGVLTDKGLALLAKWQAGRCTPQITRAGVGSGSYGTSESLTGRTALKSEKLSCTFSAKIVQNSSTLVLRFIASNETLTAGFRVTEIGIFATDPDEGEILYSMAVSEDEGNADYLPAYNGAYPSSIIFNYQIEVANAESVTIVAGSGAYAPADDLYALQDQVAEVEQTANDAALAVEIVTQRMKQLADSTSERGTATLNNSNEFPFFNSTLLSPVTIALNSAVKDTDYIVNAQVLEVSDGTAGTIEISDRLTNGFKMSFTGSAKSVKVAYEVVATN